MSIFTKLILFLIKGYQLGISPLLGNRCRYYPSCSCYMSEAIKIKGLKKGFWMGIKRLFRCHPFAEGGYDPVSFFDNRKQEKNGRNDI